MSTRTRKNNGGPAFPVPAVFSPECGTLQGEAGMTLRDWFAGQALAGLCAQDGWDEAEQRARWAWKHADAMLQEKDI